MGDGRREVHCKQRRMRRQLLEQTIVVWWTRADQTERASVLSTTDEDRGNGRRAMERYELCKLEASDPTCTSFTTDL